MEDAVNLRSTSPSVTAGTHWSTAYKARVSSARQRRSTEQTLETCVGPSHQRSSCGAGTSLLAIDKLSTAGTTGVAGGKRSLSGRGPGRGAPASVAPPPCVSVLTTSSVSTSTSLLTSVLVFITIQCGSGSAATLEVPPSAPFVAIRVYSLNVRARVPAVDLQDLSVGFWSARNGFKKLVFLL